MRDWRIAIRLRIVAATAVSGALFGWATEYAPGFADSEDGSPAAAVVAAVVWTATLLGIRAWVPRTPPSSASDEEALRFEQLAEEWTELQRQPETQRPVRRAKRVFYALDALARRLRITDHGRSLLRRLMQHDSPNVRLAAAPYSLVWTGEARRVLEALEAQGPRPANVLARDALRQFDASRLGS